MKFVFQLNAELSDVSQKFVGSALERSFQVEEIFFSSKSVDVKLALDIADEKFQEVMRNLIYVSKGINRKRLFENKVHHAYEQNPMADLEKMGDVIRTGDGLFSFQGRFLEVLRACQQYVFDVALSHNAIEQQYPVLWPVNLYKKINYFNDFPHQVILAAPVKSDFETRDSFAKKYSKERDYHAVSMDNGIADSVYGLQCAVCDTCYYNIRETVNHPNTLYTTTNKVFRNENSATGSLDRLTEFTVRDIMFVGDMDFVMLNRQRMFDEAEKLLTLVGLESKIETADDPFFTNDAVVKNLFQSASELKHELLVKLNYSGDFMAVGSVNLHLDFFGQAFGITLPDGTPAYSGCVGIGFERLVFGLYCQYGVPTEKWPKSVLDTLNL